ncbi:nicotinate phosphoribosyltransferase [Burkholderiaceae bacterium FT117]|uniref:nicotinate phosphoribosyltransferase n=1 Tax=Zeimonas sediminis TaxID=2944268 RepID=UPI002342E87F|nr:nicotinate phosphoribosyltransferase [Zeimonas sediminis]MCM5571279.1 nicotinate phosphoribosyltransferase [Zeimonas sediminis]
MPALLTDLYQLTMMQAYLEEGMADTAVFELFVRKLPPERNFLVAAGLEQALDFLETLSFSEQDLEWLAGQGFPKRFVDSLREFRFTGDVDAMPEGTVFFPDEPVLRVTAPLPQAQYVESRLLNIVHFQTLIASKAARVVLAARGRQLVDFGMRRAHGAEAALFAARAAWLAGFDATATAEAGRLWGIPVRGTMAHSFVQAHPSEAGAFEAFARARPQRPVLLVDTWDTEAAVAKAIALAPKLAADGIAIGGVRLDSGDLAAHARAVRAMLDDAGLRETIVFASGNLDEYRIARLLADAAPIDGFGVGTALDVSADAPALDAVYKLQAYAGVARRKRSEGKATWPGAKQVWRSFDANGTAVGDTVRLIHETAGQAAEARPAAGPGAGEPDAGAAGGSAADWPLLQPAMRGGRRVGSAPTLQAARERCASQLASLPAATRSLEKAEVPYPVEISEALRALAREIDASPH